MIFTGSLFVLIFFLSLRVSSVQIPWLSGDQEVGSLLLQQPVGLSSERDPLSDLQLERKVSSLFPGLSPQADNPDLRGHFTQL